MITVGVISDTHGLLRPEALAALEGSDLIVHAGDVGGADILQGLEEIAPVWPVRGNTDGGPFGASLPMHEVVEVAPPAGPLLYVVHRLEDLDLDPAAAGMAAVIYGHTHRSAIDLREQVLYFNPGAAGPRRFSLPVTVGRLLIDGSELKPEVVTVG